MIKKLTKLQNYASLVVLTSLILYVISFWINNLYTPNTIPTNSIGMQMFVTSSFVLVLGLLYVAIRYEGQMETDQIE